LFRSEAFRKTAAAFPLKVYLGYEVDYFSYDGWEEELRAFLKEQDYDYLISGNHFFQSADNQTITDVFRYDLLSHTDAHADLAFCLRHHYETMVRAVQSGLFAFLAHPDYARKIADHKLYPMEKERLNVVQALKSSNTACELSTKGLRKIGDYYPEKFVLEALIAADIPLVISDDAHKKQELGYGFDQAEQYLKDLGCRTRFHLNLCS
jgi:histidinol-phosphatase (PHP family)